MPCTTCTESHIISLVPSSSPSQHPVSVTFQYCTQQESYIHVVAGWVGLEVGLRRICFVPGDTASVHNLTETSFRKLEHFWFACILIHCTAKCLYSQYIYKWCIELQTDQILTYSLSPQLSHQPDPGVPTRQCSPGGSGWQWEAEPHSTGSFSQWARGLPDPAT